MSQLNDKARRILDYITKEIGDGVPPSVREICAALQIKSTSTVHKYLKELVMTLSLFTTNIVYPIQEIVEILQIVEILDFTKGEIR